MSDFIISLRKKKDQNTFGDQPAAASFLIINETENSISPERTIARSTWLNELLKNNPKDLLVFVHGYNDSEFDILDRHRKIKNGLIAQGYAGEVLSFDWPCGDNALMYLDDRHRADKTAVSLVRDCITALTSAQQKGCTANIHLLAHSTGAYIVRQAFIYADITPDLTRFNWSVSQIMFVSGDVSRESLSPAQDRVNSLYTHCLRFTNYFNPFDSILAISNAKRLGFSPRVGRVGLPDDAGPKTGDVNCGNYYNSIPDKKGEAFCHSWYFDDKLFMQDLFLTITAEIDRNYLPTRKRGSDLKLELVASFSL